VAFRQRFCMLPIAPILDVDKMGIACGPLVDGRGTNFQRL
jgi:hypothetical protein